jgi:hypothetical protein
MKHQGHKDQLANRDDSDGNIGLNLELDILFPDVKRASYQIY